MSESKICKIHIQSEAGIFNVNWCIIMIRFLLLPGTLHSYNKDHFVYAPS